MNAMNIRSIHRMIESLIDRQCRTPFKGAFEIFHICSSQLVDAFAVKAFCEYLCTLYIALSDKKTLGENLSEKISQFSVSKIANLNKLLKIKFET